MPCQNWMRVLPCARAARANGRAVLANAPASRVRRFMGLLLQRGVGLAGGDRRRRDGPVTISRSRRVDVLSESAPTGPPSMKLISYLQDRPPLDIRPATVQRDWMDRTRDRYAYRCLPLNIANAHGWELCCDETFEAAWNGRPGLEDIKIRTLDGATAPAISHFGSGVRTFPGPRVVRTDPSSNLPAMCPPNPPK